VGVLEAVVGFQTKHPVRGELVIITNLHTAEERAVAAAAEHVVVVAAERAADVTTEIEAGPVVDLRRNVGGSLRVGARGKVGGVRGKRQTNCCKGDRTQKERFHRKSPR